MITGVGFLMLVFSVGVLVWGFPRHQQLMRVPRRHRLLRIRQ
jgi:hypothetical protein